MEGKREKNVVALDLFVSCCKFALGEGEGVAEVQFAVHVWVGEGDHKFFGVLRGVHDISPRLLP